jgi:hypothetical protein
VAAFQAMSLDERAQFMEKRKAEHAHQQETKKATVKQKKQEDIKFLADLRTQVLGHGFTPLFFHYHLSYQGENEVQRRLFATSCVLVNKDNEPIAKGISLVSPSDNPSKMEGRIWSLQRAIEAEFGQDTYYPVSRVEARWITHNFRSSESSAAWSNKAVYTPGNSELTDIEVDRINTRRARTDVKQATT